MAINDREIRKLINTKQSSIEFEGIPSLNGMLEGQTAIQKKSNSQLSLYRKQFGKLFKSHMSADGNQFIEKNLSVEKNLELKGDLNASGLLNANTLVFNRGPELTIASGSITATHSFHLVDTQGDVSSDNLDTITAGTTGQILILKPANGSRDVVIRSGEDNIYTSGDTSFKMNTVNDTAILLADGSDWYLILSISI